MAAGRRGTVNVMGACSRSKASLRKVVVTSSVAAVSKGDLAAQPPLCGATYSEADWNTTSTVEKGEGYWVSKTRAERAAHELAAEHGLPLATILPNFVMGPVIGRRLDGISAGFMKAWLEGKASAGNITYCDVRDVARAHILAAETPAAAGRYIVSHATSASPGFISATLAAAFPELEIPAGEDLADETSIDNRRAAQELGLKLTPLATSFVDMARTLMALGLATPTLKGGAKKAAA